MVDVTDRTKGITLEAARLVYERIGTASKSVSFEVNKGQLRLSGVLGSFYHKQLAQEAVRRLDGVQRVTNEIDVTYSVA